MEDNKTVETAEQWGKIIVSIISLIIFIAALVVALVVKDEQMLTILVGIAGANATTVVGFWLGSSSSSQGKDKLIALQKPPVPSP